ncbi:MAG TPA: restriction endonuclease subunit S [Pyrinomonadaceae bacterium]|nr:restriction endonuclease subunit S [Pyrinomonadaceae bacterium]
MTPKLRFPEFRDAPGWEEKQLGNEGEFLSSLTGKSGEDFGTGSSKFVTYMNVFSNAFVDPADLGAVDVKPGEKQNAIKMGDVLFTVSSETPEDVGMSSVLLDDLGDCYVNSFCALFRFHKRTAPNPIFTGFLLRQRIAREYFSRIAQGSTRFNLSKDSFKNLPLAIPSPPEQQRIADCLSSLDESIAAHGRKLDTLKAHKKGLMQQLFPREGETLPRFRFPEFQNAGDWEDRTLGDVADVLMCKRIFANETNAIRGVPFYKIGTLGGTPDAFISKELFDDYKSKYNFPRKGEILITCSGTVGKCLQYDGSEGYYQDSNIVWIDNPTLEVSNEFLLSILSNVNWRTLNSTTITRIYGPDLRSLAMKFPQNQKEQQLIADCLSSLDEVIAVQTQKLDALRTHKKGLMQQLFPSPDEVEA